MFEVKIASHFKIVYIYFGQNAIYKCWCITLHFWSKLTAKEELNPSSLKHYSYTFKVWVQLFDQLWYYWSVGISAELKLSVLPPDNIYCSVYSERFPSNKHPHVPGCSRVVCAAAGSEWLLPAGLSWGLTHAASCAPGFVQQPGELLSPLLTRQHQCSQLQVFSLFVYLPGLQTFLY